MSHFSTIKTKIKEKKILVEALELIGERPNVPSDLGMSVVDLVITNPDHADEHPTFPVELSIGVDIETGGHVFQLHLTNSMPMHESGFITRTTSDWGSGGIHFGFNISREFKL